MTITLKQGDCREVLRTLPDASIDSCVTDPPYELGFMGKAWDNTGIANDVAMWREVLRVLKPGAHLVAFGGTRTYHRMVCAIEDAGFEIRDQIGWLYGSGFPKSLDVSKAIDKARDDRDQIAAVVRFLEAGRIAANVSRAAVEDHFGTVNIGQGFFTLTPGSSPRVPMWDQWVRLKVLLSLGDEMDAEVWCLNGRKGTPAEAYMQRPPADYAAGVGMAQSWTEGRGWNGKAARGGDGITDAARQWQGWGTALKPAFEPIVLARKPFRGTVAGNVQAHGCGALNVDGCRIGSDGGGGNGLGSSFGQATVPRVKHGEDATGTIGRWPANIIHDGSDEVIAAFPANAPAGAHVSAASPSAKTNKVYGTYRRDEDSPSYGDAGTAARFFYSAKASRHDRNDGNAGNHHPTVKPTDLMRYLCRLITPPGGTVLDPMAGSGSTLKAAELEGFSAIGIELDPEYIAIAKRRIASDAPLFAPEFAA